MQYLIILIYLFLNFSQSHDYKNNGIEIIKPVLKMVTENGKMGAGYFTIVNNTTDIITLNGITSNIAKKQEQPLFVFKTNKTCLFFCKSFFVRTNNINNKLV